MWEVSHQQSIVTTAPTTATNHNAERPQISRN